MSAVPYLPARAKLCIGSLDDPELEIRAQYNPKELQIDKQLNWQDHKSRDNKSQNGQEKSAQSDLEFKEAPKRSMTVELLFDGYEDGESVEPDIQVLEQMSSVQGPEVPAKQEDQRRPHHCIVTWGDSTSGMRPFRCVIESLAVKYTMWDRGGTPVRATCTVKLKEAQKMVGSQEPKAKYGERRRGPGWDRADPTAQDRLSVEEYESRMAARLHRR